ncbi:MAG: phospholipase [Pseudomonadales bacterium]|nr:phospholipase [Pseudomonadales bacterium]HCB41603.1 phospholipase [Pseudomonas sp.]|tara:strand:+ start:2901 stop:4427 length:1527 start_codon:yes stop_codon:yes gene_type:complete
MLRPLLLIGLTTLIVGCATAGHSHSELPSYHLPSDDNTTLSRYVSARQADSGGESGFILLHNGADALAARIRLIDMAEQSLDIQYYIYNTDVTGGLITEHLLKAADRGVRVRLLIDDVGAGLEDSRVSTVDIHPNIEVRLYNPLSLRSEWLKMFSKLGEFGRINYRMHNKLIVADNQALITGGRNIGDEYFALTDVDFQDVDVIGIGPISNDASDSFDNFWNSGIAIPINVMADAAHADDLAALRARLGSSMRAAASNPYVRAVERSRFLAKMDGSSLNWHWGKATWFYDDPSKSDPHGDGNQVAFLGRALAEPILQTEEELLLTSAYFVPREPGERLLLKLRERGVDISVLTNSLATTDVLAVHSGYARSRVPLLEGGVKMWELRPIAGQQERASPFLGESLASLHAKTFVFDRKSAFVGSVNLDPRSIKLNTEVGVLIENEELAQEMVELFQRWTSEDYAFELSLDEQGDMRWQAEGETWDTEPDASRFRRFMSWTLGWLPIASQL